MLTAITWHSAMLSLWNVQWKMACTSMAIHYLPEKQMLQSIEIQPWSISNTDILAERGLLVEHWQRHVAEKGLPVEVTISLMYCSIKASVVMLWLSYLQSEKRKRILRAPGHWKKHVQHLVELLAPCINLSSKFGIYNWNPVPTIKYARVFSKTKADMQNLGPVFSSKTHPLNCQFSKYLNL